VTKRIKVTVDARDFQDLLSEFGNALDEGVANSIGDQVIIKMKQLIAKGISPIENHGRFPEYKSQQQEKGKSKKAKATLKKKYPDTVLGDFPGKRRRPVNLELSGDFLRDGLDHWIEGLKSKFQVAIGFKIKKYVNYERGHREQANGQGFRPIIPQDDEKFVKQIRTIINSLLKDAINLYANRKR
jgi:hypothetical protein